MTLEQLATTYPRLVDGLAAHPGVGALLIRSDAHGALVIGRSGINFLDEGRVEGVDPVAQYGGRSREALIRLDTLEHCPDISVISLYDPAFEEVAAFEELIGSHGGLGGIQTLPLLLHPSEWTLDEELVGAPPSTGRSAAGRSATWTSASARAGRPSPCPCLARRRRPKATPRTVCDVATTTSLARQGSAHRRVHPPTGRMWPVATAPSVHTPDGREIGRRRPTEWQTST